MQNTNATSLEAAGEFSQGLANGASRQKWRQWSALRRIIFACLVVAITVGALIRDVVYMDGQQASDIYVYHCYAGVFWHGEQIVRQYGLAGCAQLWNDPWHRDRQIAGTSLQRFHAFPSEYPDLALAVFSLPLLLPWLSYTTAFILWMAFFVLLVTGLLAWRGPPQAAIAFPLYVLLAGWSFTLARYDLIAGILILLALVLAQRGKARAAVAILAVAALLKIFAIVLLPALLIAYRRKDLGRWRIDLVTLFALVCLVGVLPELLLNPAALWTPVQYALNRPPHIESVPGIMLWITNIAGVGVAPGTQGAPHITTAFYSLNVVGGSQSLWTTLCQVGGIVGVIAAYCRAWRGWDSLGRTFTLILVVLLVSQKVFSPQYLLWVLPVVAFVEGMRLRWLIIAALTWVIMNCYFIIPLGAIFLPWAPQFIAAIVARNLLLGELALVYLLMPGDLVSKRWPNSALWHFIGATRNLVIGRAVLVPLREHSSGVEDGTSPKR